MVDLYIDAGFVKGLRGTLENGSMTMVVKHAHAILGYMMSHDASR